jgi:hypothetical protein
VFFPGGETVTVRDTPTTDRTGDPTSIPGTRSVDGVGIEQLGTRSDTERRNTTITEYRLFFPAGDPIAEYQQVQLPNDTVWCRIVGRPAAWHSPLTSWEPGIVVLVERIR